MAIIAAVYCAFMIFNIFMFVWDPDGVYYINRGVSPLHGRSLPGRCRDLDVAWTVRKKQGMELEAVAKEIPVE